MKKSEYTFNYVVGL